MLQKIKEGQWYYPVKQFPYDNKYIEKYNKYATTDLGVKITKTRCELIKKYNREPSSNLDVGVGSGEVVKALNCYGYDVNPYMVEELCNNGKFVDLYDDLQGINSISFFDSFEHIYDIKKVLNNIKQQIVVISLPIYNGEEKDLKNWKHYREDEHFHYFTKKGFIDFVNTQSFLVLDISSFETDLGRQDIETFVIKRV